MPGDREPRPDRRPDVEAAAADPASSATLSRRTALGIGAAVVAGAALGPVRPATAADRTTAGTSAVDAAVLDRLRPEILTRDAWGADLPVVDPIQVEDDVRFLLVHHTASTNAYAPDEVVDQIRGFHRFHTGPDKGWPDVAYNFFVDRFGGIWEARAGSIAGAVRGDATGGSQGFALLCSLIGNHAEEPPTEEAEVSLTALLAWLGERNGVDTKPGATVSFESRGSNRWPAGAIVETATIAGHRDMSQTTCPGDFGYQLVTDRLPRAVSDLRLAARASVTTTTSAPAATLVTPSTAPPTTGATDESTDPRGADGTGSANGTDGQAAPTVDRESADDDAIDPATTIAAVAAVGVAAAGTAAVAARRRSNHRPT
ncbi:MAG: N-acetylmuramoyl-L-alanine amidase [Actinomycetota bacterium]